MEFKLSGWNTGDMEHPTPQQRQFTLAAGVGLGRMAYLSPALVRSFHRMAFDNSLTPRARMLCMAAVTYLVSPIDFVAAGSRTNLVSTLDDLYVVWAVLLEVLDLHGPDVLERHWRSDKPVVDVLVLMDMVPELEARVPSKALAQIREFLQPAHA